MPLNEIIRDYMEENGFDCNDLGYDYSEFMTDAIATECCPDCGSEEEIKQNGQSNCSHCNHKGILPCANCPLNDLSQCDWSATKYCTPFPIEKSGYKFLVKREKIDIANYYYNYDDAWNEVLRLNEQGDEALNKYGTVVIQRIESEVA
tara:strand:+ start:280 stop:723 length:444 start_codon:yes stop_codon:yes gene_type:complete